MFSLQSFSFYSFFNFRSTKKQHKRFWTNNFEKKKNRNLNLKSILKSIKRNQNDSKFPDSNKFKRNRARLFAFGKKFLFLLFFFQNFENFNFFFKKWRIHVWKWSFQIQEKIHFWISCQCFQINLKCSMFVFLLFFSHYQKSNKN